MIVEVCLDSLDSVEAAAIAGAQRIELCAALAEGGLTPSLGVLQQARQIFPGEIAMMIRPRGGDFFYSPSELRSMAADIRLASAHGADAVVFGCLDADGFIDETACLALLDACNGLPAVFHRAIDVSVNLSDSLETLIRLGFRRILSSGGHPSAPEGAAVLAALIRQAAGRIEILPGGGITPENATELIATTGTEQIHLTGRVTRESPMRFRRPEIPMGALTLPGEYERRTTSPEKIRSLLG
ncbi:MAG: hypothetical protein MUF31_07945 [Akkermansiaceae bacterium]|jgi:copper homeostasis protein|nr:hypothetical protein [Akkermansiaceae bacterium]